MAKSTHAQEATTGTSDSYTPEELSDPKPSIIIRRAMLGEVDQPLVTTEVGTHSSQSSESDELPSESENQFHQSPAQTTVNPSSETDSETFDADSTDGHGQEAERNQSASTTNPRRAAKKAPAKKTASTRVIPANNEFDEFN